MDADFGSYSIREANDRGISSLLDELKEVGLVALTKREAPVALLCTTDPELLKELQAYSEEAGEEAMEEGKDEFGQLAFQASSLMEWGLQIMEESDAEMTDEESLVYTVTEVNQKGISWMCNAAEGKGLLAITRYGEIEVLVMPFTPEGIHRYSDRLIEIADRVENYALGQLQQTVTYLNDMIGQARQIRSMALGYRDHIKPDIEELHQENGEEEMDEGEAPPSSETDT